MWSEILSLLAPSRCRICDRLGAGICLECIQVLAPDSVARAETRIWLAAGHHPELVRLVVAWKDGGRRADTAALADLVAAKLSAERWWQGDGFAIVPVPSRPESRRSRGWQPVPELAEAVCRLTGAEFRPVLDWDRKVADQRGLTSRQRRANLAGAFRLAADPPSKAVVLDDILTSGATLAEAAGALKMAQVGEVRLAAITSARAGSRRPRNTDQNPLAIDRPAI